jgi:hypothetical protein
MVVAMPLAMMENELGEISGGLVGDGRRQVFSAANAAQILCASAIQARTSEAVAQ